MRYLLLVLVIACSSRDERKPAPVPTTTTTTAPPAGKPLPRTVVWAPLPAAPPFLVDHVRSEGQHRCAIARDGRVACWGDLGGSPYLHTGVAHLLTGVEDAIDVAHSGLEVCILRRDGSGGCMPTSGTSEMPALPAAGVELEQTAHLLCVRERAGGIACHDQWERTPFAPIAGITGATSLTCMANSCCATTPTGVRCFGDGAPDIGMAESKEGRALSSTVPVATQIAYHGTGACVRTAAGGAHCWGDAAKLTQPTGARGVAEHAHDLCVIGDDDAVTCTQGPLTVTNVVAADHGCMTHADGSASCTGVNFSGEVGDGYPTFVTTPKLVPDLGDVVDLRVTETQACAIARDRSMTCWGWASRTRVTGVTGLFGSGDEPACSIAARTLTCYVAKSSASVPLVKQTTSLAVRSVIKAFAMSGDTICVVDRAGALSCAQDIWNEEPEWIRIASAPVAEIDEGEPGFCVRLVDGRVGCIDTEEDLTPNAMVIVPGIDDATQLASGSWGTCVLTKEGHVQCWNEREPDPRTLPGLFGATQISTRGMHTCAILRGELWCTGINTLGQLGDGTRDDPPDRDAVRVKTSFKPVVVRAAGQATCALDDRGQVWCWGSDRHGGLGLGRVQHVDSPSKVVGLGPR